MAPPPRGAPLPEFGGGRTHTGAHTGPRAPNQDIMSVCFCVCSSNKISHDLIHPEMVSIVNGAGDGNGPLFERCTRVCVRACARPRRRPRHGVPSVCPRANRQLRKQTKIGESTGLTTAATNGNSSITITAHRHTSTNSFMYPIVRISTFPH
jgi:hypothetical protein